MTEKTNDQTPQIPNIAGIAIGTEYFGCYLMQREKKVYRFEFPGNNSLAENLEIISFLKVKVEEAIKEVEKKVKEEAEKKAKEEIEKKEEKDS